MQGGAPSLSNSNAESAANALRLCVSMCFNVTLSTPSLDSLPSNRRLSLTSVALNAGAWICAATGRWCEQQYKRCVLSVQKVRSHVHTLIKHQRSWSKDVWVREFVWHERVRSDKAVGHQVAVARLRNRENRSRKRIRHERHSVRAPAPPGNLPPRALSPGREKAYSAPHCII